MALRMASLYSDRVVSWLLNNTISYTIATSLTTYISTRFEYCGHRLRYNSHYENCLNYPLECPNKCGQRDIRRKDLNDHCENCPLEPVDCPFRDAGCDMKPARKHLEMHMAAETQQHLLLVMKAHQALQRRCDELQLTRSSILASMDSLSETCTEDQQEVLQTVKTIIQRSYKVADRYLRKEGDSAIFKMTNFFHYKKSRRVWRSPPFYIQEGYKMCLEVHAGGVGLGAGSHVSLSLLLMKGGASLTTVSSSPYIKLCLK